MDYYLLSAEDCLREVKSNLKDGLSEKEAEKRVQSFGLNILPEKSPPSSWKILLEQFLSPLVYILLFAFSVSVFLSHWEDALVIVGALILNTVLGFLQEKKAISVMEQLKKLIHPHARVLRDGHEQSIPAENLVPGDIVVLSPGDKIPADLRLVEEYDLQVIESALTGESTPVSKDVSALTEEASIADRQNMVFLGTVVSKGKGRGVVVSTGQHTELGQIALLVSETKDEITPLQRQVKSFSGLLTRLVGLACFFIFVLGVLQGREVFEMLSISVAVAVAAIPEGLLVALTVVLAIGMQRILRRQGLIRHLVAAETLGSTSVICTDKTGTLTKGEMQVAHIHSVGTDLSEEMTFGVQDMILKIGVLCNDVVVENMSDELEQWRMLGDPTEKALFLAGIQKGMDIEQVRQKNPRLAEIPFSEDRKYMATLHEDLIEAGQKKLMVKGAPELILQSASFWFNGEEVLPLTGELRDRVRYQIDDLSGRGLRLLALAYADWGEDNERLSDSDLQNLVFAGLVSLKDPLREDATETIKLCRQAGIHAVLITGDHLLTAKSIALEVGLEAGEDNILEGKELAKLSDEELKSRIRNISVYARVTPEQKLRIVDAWQAVGEVVAMTGDGVNDAPALKSADIGVALGSGTEVAKEASDLVLLDDRFATIVAAVREGRTIFDNLRKIITYLLSDSFSEMILIGGSILLGLPSPIAAAQILWVNLITDGLPHLALSIEPEESDVMARNPRSKEEEIVNLEMKILIFVIGVFTDLILFGIFFWLLRHNYETHLIQTLIFAALGTDSLFYVFSCKSLRRPIWRINIFSNIWLILAVFGGWFMQIVSIYWSPLQRLLGTVSLSRHYWIPLIFLGLLEILAVELVKEVFIHRQDLSESL